MFVKIDLSEVTYSAINFPYQYSTFFSFFLMQNLKLNRCVEFVPINFFKSPQFSSKENNTTANHLGKSYRIWDLDLGSGLKEAMQQFHLIKFWKIHVSFTFYPFYVLFNHIQTMDLLQPSPQSLLVLIPRMKSTTSVVWSVCWILNFFFLIQKKITSLADISDSDQTVPDLVWCVLQMPTFLSSA